MLEVLCFSWDFVFVKNAYIKPQSSGSHVSLFSSYFSSVRDSFLFSYTYSYGHVPVITDYKRDYTFYKWGFLSTYNLSMAITVAIEIQGFSLGCFESCFVNRFSPRNPGQSSGGGSGIGTGAVFPTLTQRFSGGMIQQWELTVGNPWGKP